ncbi:murein biosynthesis integral membrane protein MurJ [Arcanobacterium hippocoleae]|uniref:murein biosynthesis integral membrane protein MurJ n=1 Tax=Arcanobacterium hippocoleae TaxID=149017 RepID=UPI00366E86B9
MAKSSLIMALGTFVSRILGMIRSPILLTLVVGLNSPIASSFDVANQLPNIVFNIIAGGLINAVLVPAIVQAAQRERGDASQFINKLITLSIVTLGLITLVITLCAPFIVTAFASTMDQQWYQITVIFAYWCLPQIFFYGLYSVFGQILNARESFGPYTWAPVLNNVVAIIGFLIILIVFGSPTLPQTQDVAVWTGSRSLALAIFSTFGVAMQALILFLPMRWAGIRYRPDFNWRGTGLGNVGKTSFWVLLTTLAGIIPTMIQTNVFAGTLPRAKALGLDLDTVAGNAAHTVTNSIYYLPISLVAVSITTATFTKVSRAAAAQKFRQVSAISARTANTLASFSFLATTLMIVLAYPIARVFVPGGSNGEINSLAWLIMVSSVAVTPGGLILVFKNICYACNATRAAFFAIFPAQITVAGGILLCGLFPPQYTVLAGEALFIFTNSLSAFALMWYSRKLIGHIGGWYMLRTHLALMLVTAICVTLGLFTMHKIGFAVISANIFIAMLTIICASIIITALYFAFGKLFRISQIDQMLDFLRKTLRKFTSRSTY